MLSSAELQGLTCCVVLVEGIEPPKPKQLIYSQPHLTNRCLTSLDRVSRDREISSCRRHLSALATAWYRCGLPHSRYAGRTTVRHAAHGLRLSRSTGSYGSPARGEQRSRTPTFYRRSRLRNGLPSTRRYSPLWVLRGRTGTRTPERLCVTSA